MIEYVKEMKFSAKRQKLISVYEFICPMIKSQHTSDRSQSHGSGNDGAGGKKDDTESVDSGNGDVEYVGWSVSGGKMILAGKSSATQGKTKQALLYGVSCTEELEEKNKEAAMTEEDIDLLLGGSSVESTEEKESLLTEEDVQVLLDGASVTSTKQKECKIAEDKVEVSSVCGSVGTKSFEPTSIEELASGGYVVTTEPGSTEELAGGSSVEVKDTEVVEKSGVMSLACTEELAGGSSAKVKDPEIHHSEDKSEVLPMTEHKSTEEIVGGASAEVKDTEIKEKSEVLSVTGTEPASSEELDNCGSSAEVKDAEIDESEVLSVTGSTEELENGGGSAEVKDAEMEEKLEVLSVTGTEPVNNASTEKKTEETGQSSENFEDSEKEHVIIDVVDVINIMPLPDVNCQTSEFCIDNLSPVKEETIVPQIK